MRDYQLWIGNRWVESVSSETISVIDPATEEEVGRVPLGVTEDVERAVLAAKNASPGWQAVSADDRVDLLREVAQRMTDAAPDLAVTLTHETGRMKARNQMYVEWSARFFDYYAQLARDDRGKIVPSSDPGAQVNMVLKIPYGVVGCICPFNYPISLLTWKLAPALAAGNTVVIKPAPQTPLATLEMVEGCFSHLPPGVVNVVTGDAEAGRAMVQHPDVPLIAFTGSVRTGQKISEMAASFIKRLHLELGGNDAAVICADVDLDSVIRGVAWGSFLNAGQVCTSVERVFVEASIYDEFAERLAQIAKKLIVGSGFDPATQITPMISAAARERVHATVREAIEHGASLLAGGAIPPGAGFAYPPTVLGDCAPDMRIMREETFGPVLGLTPFDDFDEALLMVNDSDYALGASIHTHDARRVRRFYEQVEAGTIWVNDFLVENMAAPFGGMKLSGLGREMGSEGLDAFRQSKHVHWDIEAQAKSWWFA
jgi:betaine-aldehyde dehydrogenase